MSNDRMNDVFPVLFNYVKGESPTSQKLTGEVKHIDIAFAGITQAVGDPWDYQSHAFDLSIDKLGISSLARIIGPSDYLGPHGGVFNESGSTTRVTLDAGKNSWNLGYPLIKVTADAGEEASSGGAYSPLTWGVDIVVPYANLTFVTEVSSLEDIDEAGDFYVDYYKGVITAYNKTTTGTHLDISNIHFLGAGVPWGTHNVIPTWNETSNLCSVVHVGDTPSISTWTLSFPTITKSPRISTIGKEIGGTISSPDSEWEYSIPGYGSSYRLPRSVTTAGLTPGDAIPTGYLLLWEESTGRIVPNVLFYYRDSTSLTITTPYSSTGYITAGSDFRVLTSGTSISEAVSYLLATQRYNQHNGFNGNYNESYTTPISHNNLTDLYTGRVSDDGTLRAQAFRYRKSSYSVNPHPQYIHRAGYLADDLNGNTANAMRGNFVFAGQYNSTDGYLCSGGKTSSGNTTETYGIQWGGGETNTLTGNTRLAFEGGEDISTWVSSYAHRFGFGVMAVGAVSSDAETNERWGALTLTPWYGTPLYLRGPYLPNAASATSYTGAVLGFDYGQKSELNYLKLYPAIRSGSFDVKNLPANTGQTGFALRSWLMPGIANRVSPDQIRELRFRGVSYISSATNTTNSIGGSTTRGSATTISELQHYFTSPGILGADFVNIYSNAIFFSDDGTGQTTSFTDLGETWLNETVYGYTPSDAAFSENMPTGIYYSPYDSGNVYSFSYCFSIFDTGESASTQPLMFGDKAGFIYTSTLGGNVSFATQSGHIALLGGSTSHSDYLSSTPTDNGIYLHTDDDIHLKATYSGSVYSQIYVNDSGSISLTSTGGTIINAASLTATIANNTTLTTSGHLYLTANDDSYLTGDRVCIHTGTRPTSYFPSTSDYLLISSNHSVEVTSLNQSAVLRGENGVFLFSGQRSSPNSRSIRLEKTVPSGEVDMITLEVQDQDTSPTYYSKMQLNGNASISSFLQSAGTFSLSSTGGNVELKNLKTAGEIRFQTESSDVNHTGIFIKMPNGTIPSGTLKVHATTGEIYID